MSKPQLLSALNLPRNYPLSTSTALCVNTAFAYPYYILPILFPHEKSLGLSPAIFGIMQSVMHGVIVSRIAGGKYSPGFAVIGVAGPNVVGKNKNTPYCGSRNRRDRTMLNQPDARARCGGVRRQCDAAGHAGGKRVTRSGFGFARPRP